MAELVYVDHSNVYIEGKRVLAVSEGMAQNVREAGLNDILDHGFRLDFGRLRHFVAGKDRGGIKRCVLFGSEPTPSGVLWQLARQAGFEVILEGRNPQNREKRIDTGIVAAMARDAYTIADRAEDTITLVAGDGDFVPIVQLLVADGFCVHVAFWQHAARELRRCCSCFVPLDPVLDYLAYKGAA